MEAAGHFVERRESMQTNNKMAVAPVGKLIWQMSIPPLISMFLQYSYNLIDSAFVARLSENALTAVSLSFPITTLMNAASIWIGVGVNVLIAGYLGQKKQDTHQDSTIQIYKTVGNVSQGIESWWFKRNEEHQQPEVSQKIDLSKYDAYYVDPKCTEKKIYLTFDCGYENGFTPKILDVLKRQKVVAAFFVTKPFIREEAKLVKRMKKEGHIVGNHTVHHKSMPTLSDRDNKQEIIDCAQYCKEATGYDMDPFIRPPMGEYNERTLALTKKMGYRTIFWSMAYVDFKVDQQPGKDYVIEHFQKYTHKGAIPLIHNISRSNAEALETVIINLKKDGYRFEGLKKLPDY